MRKRPMAVNLIILYVILLLVYSFAAGIVIGHGIYFGLGTILLLLGTYLGLWRMEKNWADVIILLFVANALINCYFAYLMIADPSLDLPVFETITTIFHLIAATWLLKNRGIFMTDAEVKASGSESPISKLLSWKVIFPAAIVFFLLVCLISYFYFSQTSKVMIAKIFCPEKCESWCRNNRGETGTPWSSLSFAVYSSSNSGEEVTCDVAFSGNCDCSQFSFEDVVESPDDDAAEEGVQEEVQKSDCGDGEGYIESLKHNKGNGDVEFRVYNAGGATITNVDVTVYFSEPPPTTVYSPSMESIEPGEYVNVSFRGPANADIDAIVVKSDECGELQTLFMN